MKRAETCSYSLCNKFYTYLYHHIIVLDKYIHSNLVYCLSCFLPIAFSFRMVLCCYLVQKGMTNICFQLSLVCRMEVGEGTLTKRDVIFEES